MLGLYSAVYSQDLKSVEKLSLHNKVQVLKYDILSDSLEPPTSSPKRTFRMRRSPWVAVGLSAVLPGAGQFYNRSYWKVPIAVGIGSYLGYEVLHNNNKFNDFKDQYAESQTSENPSGDLTLKNQREFYRDQRDTFIIYFGIFYLINLVDAYVDAHLFDFDVSEEIKLGVLNSNGLLNLSLGF